MADHIATLSEAPSGQRARRGRSAGRLKKI